MIEPGSIGAFDPITFRCAGGRGTRWHRLMRLTDRIIGHHMPTIRTSPTQSNIASAVSCQHPALKALPYDPLPS